MKKIENKEVGLEITNFRTAEGKRFEVMNNYSTTSYFDLLLEIIKTPEPGGGLGDLEQQQVKFKILNKIQDGLKKVKDEKDKDEPDLTKLNKINISLEDEEAKVIKTSMAHVKYLVLNEDLIAFQKKVSKW